MSITTQLAQDLKVQIKQVAAAVELLDSGATVPFIARYRKEATGGLDDTVLRELEVRLSYVRELEQRRSVVLESITQQGKLDAPLQALIMAADSKQRLEDLYAPFKPKRRTRGQIACEAGIEPLADALLQDAGSDPTSMAQEYINAAAGFDDAKAVLNGARDILAERFAEDPAVVAALRTKLLAQAYLVSKVVEGKAEAGNKFRDWFDFSERLSSLPSHRVLALLRGREQGVLSLQIQLKPELEQQNPHPCVALLASELGLNHVFGVQADARQAFIADTCRWSWRVKLLPRFETELIGKLREDAQTEAIRVFAANLKDLLLAAPAGPKAVLGLDPGIRTGVKLAAIDATGKVLATATIYPFEPRRDINGSLQTLARLIKQHAIELVAIGNGTASRETEALVKQLRSQQPELEFQQIVVSEAGASVYSASELAAQEFPDLDVSLRGAVSIARRLQDPLAELVKIEPKAIGVGQYQHDVNQRQLAHSLDAVVEDCVNAVGVDVNTASMALLQRVSGLNKTLASNIVQHREANGAFKNRQQLHDVSRFGAKSFEQAAGFLRIPDSDNPLDASAVHPEAYPLAEQIILKTGLPIQDIMGQAQALHGLAASEFVSSQFGLPTIKDIFAELEKPGRDPRPEFRTAKFATDIHTIKDLKVGQELEGVVSNVANFGAFVDLGVHQDGLIHVSELADRFVKDPREVVRVGQTVKVRVIEVDPERQRIALSMRKQVGAQQARARRAAKATDTSARAAPPKRPQAAASGAMAQAFERLQKKPGR